MITVRRIEPHQAGLLRAVRLAALADTPTAFGSTLERELGFDEAEWVNRARHSAAGDERCIFFAWHDDERIAGIAGGYRVDPADPPLVDLVSMWIDPSSRRSGTARRLIDAVVEWATDLGAERVDLWVTRGNEPARLLYEATGFTETGDHQPLPSDPCKDEIRMVRDLR